MADEDSAHISKKRRQVRVACVGCRQAKTSCDEKRPCQRCLSLNLADKCRDSVHKKRGRRRQSSDGEESDLAEESTFNMESGSVSENSVPGSSENDQLGRDALLDKMVIEDSIQAAVRSSIENSLDTSADKVEGVAPFVAKCYALVTESKYNDIIAWSETGDSFIIFDTNRFSQEILPKYFKHNNLSSFIRQLNLYGFRRRVSNQLNVEFYQEHFKLSSVSELKLIGRQRAAPAAKEGRPPHPEMHVDLRLQQLEDKIMVQGTELKELQDEVLFLRQSNMTLRQDLASSWRSHYEAIQNYNNAQHSGLFAPSPNSGYPALTKDNQSQHQNSSAFYPSMSKRRQEEVQLQQQQQQQHQAQQQLPPHHRMGGERSAWNVFQAPGMTKDRPTLPSPGNFSPTLAPLSRGAFYDQRGLDNRSLALPMPVSMGMNMRETSR
eukprot:GILJ01000920.1.p1 GENE.GILJ01000920.1~~GILJ01000920.1.p1  ORF type:complete len:436 (+),score=48.03 GILJ01000920.1:501-1808(+)